MRDLAIAIFMLGGSFFILVAAIGIIRFSDLYSRMHASTKATSFGILLLIAGVSIFFGNAVVYLKAALIIIFIYLTAPLAAHAIAKSVIDRDKIR
jgi:multicomponent Na+:H+ antiporter subunit G